MNIYKIHIVLPTRTQRNYILHILSHITDADMFRCTSHHPQGSHIRTLGKQQHLFSVILYGISDLVMIQKLNSDDAIDL
jgi:hypothetical protein